MSISSIIDSVESAVMNPIASLVRDLTDDEKVIHDDLIATGIKLHDLFTSVENAAKGEATGYLHWVKDNLVDGIDRAIKLLRQGVPESHPVPVGVNLDPNTAV